METWKARCGDAENQFGASLGEAEQVRLLREVAAEMQSKMDSSPWIQSLLESFGVPTAEA